VRSYKSYDPICFKREVAQLPQHEIYSTHNVNSKLVLFNEIFLNTLNRHAPMKYSKIKGRPHKFIGKEIKQLMKVRDRRLKSFRKSKNSEDWNSFKQLRNAVKISIGGHSQRMSGQMMDFQTPPPPLVRHCPN
jgi:hypothetical protein